jgi:hypothetical protein
MKTTFVEIHERGRRKLKKALGDQFVVGRGAKAEVPLPFSKELDPHHLLCVPGEAGVWVSVAEGARAPALPTGQPFKRGTVPWGSTIRLGALELTFHSRRPPSAGAGKLARVAAAFTAIAAACVVWQLLARAEAGPSEAGEPPPDLFLDPGPCQLDPVMALGAAREAAEAGHAKAERYAYRVGDGIAAAGYYLVAERCFDQAQEREESARMRREREALKKRIENDYKVSHVRLEKTLRAGEHEEALKHVRALLGFTEGAPGAYRDWLIEVHRALEDQIAAKAAKKGQRFPWLKQDQGPFGQH